MSDNNPPNKKRWKWKRKKKRQWNVPYSLNSTNNTHQHNPNTTSHEADFTETHTTFIVNLHSRVSSDQCSSSPSQSSAPVRQVNAGPTSHCKPATSAHCLPASSAVSSAAAGPSTQTSGQRTFNSSLTATAGPTKCLAIDCEMVGAGPKGHISQLARCSIVSYNGDVVYDKFICPPLPVTDYRTRWSGIRKRDLSGAVPYDVARKEILKLLMGKVLVGHAIHNDLKVLNYNHPKDMTRDTSRIPLLNIKAGFPEKQPASLKRLTKAIFNRDIQTGRKGHSSVEDAKATMDLYKVIEVEWERKMASTSDLNTEEKINQP